MNTGKVYEFQLSGENIMVDNTREREFVLLIKFKPYAFIKTLATPVLDSKFELFIPCNNKTIKKILKKKFRCNNSKIIKLTHDVRKNVHSFTVHNNLEVDLQVQKIALSDNEKTNGVQLSPGEAYSTIHLDKGSSDQILAKVDYMLNSTDIGM